MILLLSLLLDSNPPTRIAGEADPAPIEATIATRKYAFRACAAKAKGELIVRFEIGAQGKVTSASVAKSTLRDPGVETCVIEVIKTITFEPPVGTSVVVNFPFEFGADPKKAEDKTRITQKTVAEVLELAQSSYRGCYARQLDKNTKLQGKTVTLVFNINDDGAPAKARVAESQHDVPNINECLVDVTQTLRFPKPREGEVAKVTYPVVLWPGPVAE